MLFILRILTLSLLALSPLALCSKLLAPFTDMDPTPASKASGSFFDDFINNSGIENTNLITVSRNQDVTFAEIEPSVRAHFAIAGKEVPAAEVTTLLTTTGTVTNFASKCKALVEARTDVGTKIGDLQTVYGALDTEMKKSTLVPIDLKNSVSAVITKITALQDISIVRTTYMNTVLHEANTLEGVITTKQLDLGNKASALLAYENALLAVEKQWHAFCAAAATDYETLKTGFGDFTLSPPVHGTTSWVAMGTQLNAFIAEQDKLITFINGLEKDGDAIILGNNISDFVNFVENGTFKDVFIGDYKTKMADILGLANGTVAANQLSVLEAALKVSSVDLEVVSEAAATFVTFTDTKINDTLWGEFPSSVSKTKTKRKDPTVYRNERYKAVGIALKSICNGSVSLSDVLANKSGQIATGISTINKFLSTKSEFTKPLDELKTAIGETISGNMVKYEIYRKALNQVIKTYNDFFHKPGYLTVPQDSIVFSDLQTELDSFFAGYALLQKNVVDGIGSITAYPELTSGTIATAMDAILAAADKDGTKNVPLFNKTSAGTQISTFLSNSAPNKGLSELITEIKTEVDKFITSPSTTTKLKAYLVMCKIFYENLPKVEALWGKLYTDVKSVDSAIVKPTTPNHVLTNVNLLPIIYKIYVEVTNSFILKLNQVKNKATFDVEKAGLGEAFNDICEILNAAATFGSDFTAFSGLLSTTSGPVKTLKGLLDPFVALTAYNLKTVLELKEGAALAFSDENVHKKFTSVQKIDVVEVQTLSSAHKKFFDALKLVVNKEIKTANPDLSSRNSFNLVLNEFIDLVNTDSWDFLESCPQLKASIKDLNKVPDGKLTAVKDAFKTALDDPTLLGNLQDAMCALVLEAENIWTEIYNEVKITRPVLPALAPTKKAINQVDNTVTKNSATQFDPVHEIFKNFHTAADAYFKNPNGEGLLVTLTSKFEVITKHPELDVSKYPTNAAGEVGVVKALMVPGETDKLKVGNVFDLDAVKAFFVKVNSALAALVNKTDGTFTAFPEIVVTQNNQQLSPVTSRKYYEDIVGVWNGIVADVELKIGGTGPEVAAFESKIDGLMNGAKVVSVDESALAPKRSTLLTLVTALLDCYKGQNTTKDIPGLRAKAIAVKGGLDTYFNGIAHGSNFKFEKLKEVITDGEGQKADNATVKACYDVLLAEFNKLVVFINKMEGDPTANEVNFGKLVDKIKELISSHPNISTAEEISKLVKECNELKNVTDLRDLKDKVNTFGTELKNTYEGHQATEGKETFVSPSLCTSEKPKEKGGVSGEPNTPVEDNDSKFKTFMNELIAMYEGLKTKLNEIKTQEDVTSKKTSILGLFDSLKEKLKGENLTEDQKKDPEFVEIGPVVEELEASFMQLEKKEITVDMFKIALKKANDKFKNMTENLTKKIGKYSNAVVVGIVVGSLAGGISIIIIIFIVIRENRVGNEMDLENQKGSSNEGK